MSSKPDDQETPATVAGDETRGRQIPVEILTGVIMAGVAALFLLNAGSTKLDWLFPIVLSYVLLAIAVVLMFAVAAIAYAALTPYVGFWIMTGLVITGAAVYLDTQRSLKRLIIAAAVAVAVCVVAYLTLTEIFYVEFPLGFLDQ
jgi:FtsH-binding integral membrane protein